MNHSLHGLALGSQSGKQHSASLHPLQHHTLHHPLSHNNHNSNNANQSPQQPLVNANNASQQTMLHFGHSHHNQLSQTLHHNPYSTLRQQPTVGHLSSSQHQQNAIHFSQTLASQQQQLHLQQQLASAASQQQHSAPVVGTTGGGSGSHNNSSSGGSGSQQPQYNMNSDYSSSTYHIYDQISDLIIIKQQRMERKRQLEHRRKVIVLSLAAILLVGGLLFLLLQSLLSTSSSSASLQQQIAATSRQLQLNPSLAFEPIVEQQAAATNQGLRPVVVNWRPPTTGGDSFDARGRFPVSGAGIRLPQAADQQQPSLLVNKVIHQQSSMTQHDACNKHGTVISAQIGPSGEDPSAQMVASGQQQQQQTQLVVTCKCDPGFWGERCEFSAAGATYQPPNQPSLQLAATRCLMTNNCSGNGQCNLTTGRCHCFPNFLGPNCEFRVPSIQSPSVPVMQSANNQQPQPVQPQPTQQQPMDFVSDQQQPTSGQQRCAVLLGNCNGNGQCNQQLGVCACFAGFRGDSCRERDLCHEQSCSGRGECQPASGECQCEYGFRGPRCESRDDDQWQRLLNCSARGKFDFEKRKCRCDQGFGGLDCSEERCEPLAGDRRPPDCGPNGLYDCRQGSCVCQDGYSGDRCQAQQCSAQCLRNGQCVGGQCVCRAGFYGRHCSLNGCPNECSGRGQCVRQLDSGGNNLQAQQSASGQWNSAAAEWRCQCQAGSTGDDCGLLVERQCDDQLDNDRDGLVDCADSECCGHPSCQNSTLCMKSPDPLDILMRKQPPPPTSSFFQRMQFLIEKFSSQIYSNPKDFNDSIMVSRYMDRASVIRGRVTYLKQGVTGVRVSVAGQINLGMTLSRDGGYFDLMVNGGGAVVVEFRREPFAQRQKAVRVPWNEIVLMEPVELSLERPLAAGMQLEDGTGSGLSSPVESSEQDSPSCSAHNYRLMRPQIVAAPKSTRRSSSNYRNSAGGRQQRAGESAPSSRAVILRESGTVQQSIVLPGSSPQDSSSNRSVSLVYISSRANEFMSTISVQLTPPAGANFKLPPELRLIHLQIVIEGNLFEQLFEPQSNLSFTYAWNRRNVYRQKSFGLSTAAVSVGYEYFDCRHTIWSTKLIQLPGHDLSISDIGSQWNLNIHHRYNHRDSILQRGDGQNYNLKTDKPRVVQPLIGDGFQRQASCSYCDGATSSAEQRLLKPQALLSAPDGSLYVGDYNMIRRVEWTSASGSDARQQQSASGAQQQQAPLSSSAAQQQPPGAGSGPSGERMVRTVLELPAARVPSRYSLALNLADQNKLHMTDIDHFQVYHVRESIGTRIPQLVQPAELEAAAIAAVNESMASNLDESLVPVAGNGLKCELSDRANCGDGQAARSARLIEPKALAFDLLGRMYIADGPNVRVVETDGRIYTLLGDYGATRHTKSPCSGEAVPMHKFAPKSPQDLATSPIDDSLHLLDDNVVYRVTPDKRVQVVAGRPAHCPPAGPQPTSGQLLPLQRARATDLLLQSAHSIAFGQNGDLFVSEDDQRLGLSRVLLVSPEEDTVTIYAGLPAETSGGGRQQQETNSAQLQQQLDQLEQTGETSDKQRASNSLSQRQSPTRALDYKFSSVAAICVDQTGRLIVADKLQLRLLSVEPDLPELTANGEYELQSPDNSDELLVFNRFGHHVATRELNSSGSGQRPANKYQFSYNVNTSFGQLASVGYASGNKISIYRDGPHHSVKMIETAFGGQCKLDISRHGQVHSIATSAPNATKTNLSYHVDGGLLKQSRDQASGELFEFTYDEFGRATGILHSAPRLPAPVECRVPSAGFRAATAGTGSAAISQLCAALIVSE